ncbi:hypothetical protein PIB30_020969 [Stylosanthes scabra]|uniref:Uncharacterized protein n=1 Tax=Stylosanthes scabra TaxID=79078 RepID=A0ABU6S8T6_9FABA|nr:hypothetical protein [Stylosanthes scabra]
MEEEDTIPSMMDDGVEPTVKGLSNEGKPLDPMQPETECNKDVEMESNDKDPYKELLEGVDFSTPELNNLGDAEMETQMSAASESFRRTFKELIRQNRPDVAILLETKCSSDNAKRVIQNLGFSNSIVEEAQGFVGGI